ncbi:hypothetical protein GCM10011506_15580 [Marivirga lumbricoides]|uniref:Uncharacterized protein n=1 Tax=Marivirga lumbricoides TaxID=1046115 RepID=A0ABQ1M120_9BACT|nr:hypothetical protein GCM10011506_15580 [Marivirga lumbricoides]
MALFSLQELDIAENPYILLIKNRIMEKVNGLMGELEHAIHHELNLNNHSLPKEINLNNGKISRGENYKYLPYVILDFPAFFTRYHIFAFRTMFYWGHFISFTIHLQGKYCDLFGDKLIKQFAQDPDTYFNINSTPWEYTYDDKNYKPITALSLQEINSQIEENSFIKLSKQLPVAQLAEAEQTLIPFLHSVLDSIK